MRVESVKSYNTNFGTRVMIDPYITLSKIKNRVNLAISQKQIKALEENGKNDTFMLVLTQNNGKLNELIANVYEIKDQGSLIIGEYYNKVFSKINNSKSEKLDLTSIYEKCISKVQTISLNTGNWISKL